MADRFDLTPTSDSRSARPPAESLRSTRAGPLFTVTTRSWSPSLSMSRWAAPRATVGVISAGMPARRSENRALPAFRYRCAGLRVGDLRLDAVDVVGDVPVGGEDVEQAVVVGIEEEAREGQRQQRLASEARRRRIVDEQPVALVAIERQHLVGEVADQQSRAPGAVEVGRVHAHAGARHARFVEGHAGGDRLVHERALAGVAIEPVRLRVVGHEHVEPAVGVVVEQADAEALAGGIVQAGLRGHVLERAVAEVAEQERRLALVALGRAVRLRLAVERAVDVLLELPLHVVGDDQVEPAVLVVVEPRRAASRSRRGRRRRAA